MLLVSCKIDTDQIINSNESIKINTFNNGTQTNEYSLNQSDGKYIKFISWVNANKQGWEPTLVTYAPSLLVSGKNFSFNFMGGDVVVNCESGQFAKKIQPEEYEFLRK